MVVGGSTRGGSCLAGRQGGRKEEFLSGEPGEIGRNFFNIKLSFAMEMTLVR